MCGWSIFRARMRHGHTRTHKTHHGPDLKETTTFLLIIFYVPSHGAYTQMSFCREIPKLGTPNLGVPKFLKLGLSQFWKLNFCEYLRLKWSLKQSHSPCQGVFNYMWHATYTQVNQGNFLLLLVGSQIGNLIFSPFFGHNLRFKYSNGMFEPISDIYIPKELQWYK
jgi:hypothetical protein